MMHRIEAGLRDVFVIVRQVISRAVPSQAKRLFEIQDRVAVVG